MFETWIGENYRETRLLFLGESAYAWKTENGKIHIPKEDHSISVAKNAISDRYKAQPFVKALNRALCGKKDPTKDELSIAWNRIAFTNYIQTPVEPFPRKRPTGKQWKAAPADFLRLLETWPSREPLPTRIVVIGMKSWKNMPDTPIRISDTVEGYLIRGSVVMCLAFKHTRAGLSWKDLATPLHFAFPNWSKSTRSNVPRKSA